MKKTEKFLLRNLEILMKNCKMNFEAFLNFYFLLIDDIQIFSGAIKCLNILEIVFLIRIINRKIFT